MGGRDGPAHQVDALSPALRLSPERRLCRPCPATPIPCPHLGLPRQSQDLPQVVQEAHEVEPVWEGEEQGGLVGELGPGHRRYKLLRGEQGLLGRGTPSPSASPPPQLLEAAPP